MGRLTAIKPRLKAPAAKVTRPVVADRKDDGRRSDGPINTYRWQKLREKILQRDGYICQQTGVPLIGARHAPNSPVVDHIEPHRGDLDLFWDENNLQSVAKSWHDKNKQSLEKRGIA